MTRTSSQRAMCAPKASPSANSTMTRRGCATRSSGAPTASIAGPPGRRHGPRSTAFYSQYAKRTATVPSVCSLAIPMCTTHQQRCTPQLSFAHSALETSSPRAPSTRCRHRLPPASCSEPVCPSRSPTLTAPTSCSSSAPTQWFRTARCGRLPTSPDASAPSRHAGVASSSSIPFEPEPPT